MDSIRFGTAGWRSFIAEKFTFGNVRRVAWGLGVTLRRGKKSCRVLVGFDTRFHSDRFAQAAAEVLASQGHQAVLSKSFLPTPALSLALGPAKADAGVMITASHNSASYNGFKIKLPPGVSAPSAFTQEVEKNIPSQLPQAARKKAGIPSADWLSGYLRTVQKRVDIAAIRKSGLKIVVDPMHGVGQRQLEEIVLGGRATVHTVEWERDAFFGGRQPEPVDANLGPLKKAVRRFKADAGFATDGDGDRVGMVDEKGNFVDVHKIHAILLRHLRVHRGMKGAVVKTVSGTLMVERMARHWDFPLFETPIGFKHIGEVMLREDVLLGAEESGGIAVKGHLPERDGLFSALLLLEALAYEKKTVTECIRLLQKEFGPCHSGRLDVEDIPFQRQQKILSRLRQSAPARVAGERVTGIQTLDGVKLKFQDAWALVRPSGTEPLLRLYAEAPSAGRVRSLLSALQREVSLN